MDETNIKKLNEYYAPRQQQLDSIIWDNEFDRQVRLLIGRIGFVNTFSNGIEKDLELLARCYIFITLMRDHTTGVGQKCYDLRLYNAKNESKLEDLTLMQKYSLAFVNLIIPWLSSHSKIRDSLRSILPNSLCPNSSPLQNRNIGQNLTWWQKFVVTTKLMRIFSFCLFLMQGKYRSLEERVLGIICGPNDLIRAQQQRNNNRCDDASYDLMNRELLWQSMMEFMELLLPLTNYHKLRNSFSRFIGLEPPLQFNTTNEFIECDCHKKKQIENIEKLSADDCTDQRRIEKCCTKCNRTNRNDKKQQKHGLFNSKHSLEDLQSCAICDKIPVNPHEIGCRHVFCYYCVYSTVLADPTSGVLCPKCRNFRAESQSIRRLSIYI